VNKDKLKGQIRSLGMTQGDVAEKIGVSLSRFNAKINETDGAEFSLGEVQALKGLLNLNSEQVDQIFFS
jgi:DNA-binding XRE family transcriptional regulator